MKCLRPALNVIVLLCLNSTHLAEWQVMVLLFQEVDVSGRNDAHQLATHFAVVCDGDAAKAVASLGLEDVPYAFVGAHHHRVCDEALLVTLEEEGEEGGVRKNLGAGAGEGAVVYKKQKPLPRAVEQRMQGKIQLYGTCKLCAVTKRTKQAQKRR